MHAIFMVPRFNRVQVSAATILSYLYFVFHLERHHFRGQVLFQRYLFLINSFHTNRAAQRIFYNR